MFRSVFSMVSSLTLWCLWLLCLFFLVLVASFSNLNNWIGWNVNQIQSNLTTSKLLTSNLTQSNSSESTNYHYRNNHIKNTRNNMPPNNDDDVTVTMCVLLASRPEWALSDSCARSTGLQQRRNAIQNMTEIWKPCSKLGTTFTSIAAATLNLPAGVVFSNIIQGNRGQWDMCIMSAVAFVNSSSSRRQPVERTYPNVGWAMWVAGLTYRPQIMMYDACGNIMQSCCVTTWSGDQQWKVPSVRCIWFTEETSRF